MNNTEKPEILSVFFKSSHLCILENNGGKLILCTRPSAVDYFKTE